MYETECLEVCKEKYATLRLVDATVPDENNSSILFLSYS